MFSSSRGRPGRQPRRRNSVPYAPSPRITRSFKAPRKRESPIALLRRREKGRPRGRVDLTPLVGQPFLAAAVGIHEVELAEAVTVGDENDPTAVGRPRGFVG